MQAEFHLVEDKWRSSIKEIINAPPRPFGDPDVWMLVE